VVFPEGRPGETVLLRLKAVSPGIPFISSVSLDDSAFLGPFRLPEVIENHLRNRNDDQENNVVPAEEGFPEGLLIDQHLEYQTVDEPGHNAAGDPLQQRFFQCFNFSIQRSFSFCFAELISR